MDDKSWLLNLAALTAARTCINTVEDELGVKLKLSHPQFLDMIHEYAELTGSAILNENYQSLKKFSLQSDQDAKNNNKILRINTNSTVVAQASHQSTNETEMVTFKGRVYPRFDDDGHEFKGLYRGQARYA